jgi:peptidoglycan/xylan/chitin deacetylase (PgdA/CDA1 family)
MNWLERKTLGLFVKTNGYISKSLLAGMGHIFMLHRVLPEKLRNAYSINRDLAITPEALEEFIQYFISKNYMFISLNELSEILAEGRNLKQKFICFTLDDGYKDNLEYGLPLFLKYNIPVTIYITNCFPNNTAILWWYMLEEVILKKSTFFLFLADGEKKFSWKNEKEGLECFSLIRNEIRRIPKPIFRNILFDAFKTDTATLSVQNTSMFLTWKEIRQLSTESLVTIGAHTMNHLSLTSLTDAELSDEIISSKAEIEKYITKEVNHFAYPYGGIEDAYSREYEFVKKAGFKTATLNKPGNIFTVSADQTECLPRMPLGNSTSKEKLEFILNGINHYSYNSFNKKYY